MKVLVIGGAGYIGSHVVLELLDNDFEVIVFDDLSLGFKNNVDKRADFLKGSTLNTIDLKAAFSTEPDVVIHLAAFKAAGESMENPQKFSVNNITGTLNVLNIMLEQNVRKFVFSSTAAIYGFPNYLPVDEKHPTNPVNYYGYTKLVIEENLKWYSDLKGLSFVSLRYFNAAGYDPLRRITIPEQNPQNLIPIVMEVAKKEKNVLNIYGNDYDTKDGTCIRDYIHVTDLASAHVKALDLLKNEPKYLCLNLGTGNGYSVMDVVNKSKEITRQSIPHNVTGRRKGDPPILIASHELANKCLDWHPEYSDLETILKTTWDMYSVCDHEIAIQSG
jgi:UDP-glucose 4-epimerase